MNGKSSERKRGGSIIGGGRGERDENKVQGALVVIASEQPVLYLCVVFLCFAFSHFFIFCCLDLPPLIRAS